MNAGTDVVNYLGNAVPADLQLSLGYFAIRNRSPAEAARGGLSVRAGGGAAPRGGGASHPAFPDPRARRELASTRLHLAVTSPSPRLARPP